MPTLVNDPAAQDFPITIQTSVSSSGALTFTANGVAVPANSAQDALVVKHKRVNTNDPVVVPISIVAPGTGWQIDVSHELDSRELLDWDSSGGECSHTWAETDRLYAVVVTTSDSSSGEKKETVYLRVRPEPDLPDL